MDLPRFTRFMRPVLESLSDGSTRHRKELRELACRGLDLSDEQMADQLKSGKSKAINRASWAITYLGQAGLVESPAYGTWKLAPRGQQVLKTHDGDLVIADLMQYVEFQEFRKRSGRKKGAEESGSEDPEPSMTAEERLEQAFDELNSQLADDVRSSVQEMDPSRFERLIIDLMLKLGYGGPDYEAGQHIGGVGDGGIDGIINLDRLGLSKVFLQAKRWSNTVGRQEIQSFVGALSGHGANVGVFITTSSFSQGARDYAKGIPSPSVRLIDGDELARLMIECDLGVSPVRALALKRVDSDFFADE